MVDGANKAIDFYKRAFGAQLEGRLVTGQRVMFAALRIGDLLAPCATSCPA